MDFYLLSCHRTSHFVYRGQHSQNISAEYEYKGNNNEGKMCKVDFKMTPQLGTMWLVHCTMSAVFCWVGNKLLLLLLLLAKDLKDALDLYMKQGEDLNCTDAVLKPWQIELMKEVNKPTDRHIIWVIGKKGNEGKTWFQNYINPNLEQEGYSVA